MPQHHRTQSPWLSNCLCHETWTRRLCLAAGWCHASCPGCIRKPLPYNCLCFTKHGPDTCAWLQVAAKQAALAALETQLGSTSASASHTSKPSTQQLPLCHKTMDQTPVPGCRLLPSKLPWLHQKALGLTTASVSRNMDQMLVLDCRLLPSKLPCAGNPARLNNCLSISASHNTQPLA